MDNLVQLTDLDLKKIEAGKREWILAGCLVSPVMACFCIGYYLEYNS
jgi:predicted Co/Zn/Cd cation transporter (cation efflux family)